MHVLGIPTTRALAAVATGEAVHREGELPGAVLTRVARSHVRVGTFEYFAARRDTEALRQLADYVIARHYPEAAEDDRPYRALLDAVIERQAGLIALWLGVGFIHGVMNTDNMSIAGETIDYGPAPSWTPITRARLQLHRPGRALCLWQPVADRPLEPVATRRGLLPLLDEDQASAVDAAQAAIDAFPARFERAYLERFRTKLGLGDAHPDDADLIADLLQAMSETGADFTNTFRALCDTAEGADGGFRTELGDSRAATEWLQRWRLRLAGQPAEPGGRAALMRRANPAVIPRNHRVEAALAAAVQRDLGPLDALLRVLGAPWEDDPQSLAYRSPPEPHEVVHRTFCGT
jgi:serine/tyrosine/threonine adenylyltransferase